MRYLKSVLVIFVIAVFFYIAFHDVNFAKAFDSLGKVSLVYPVVFILGSYFQMFIRGYRWRIILGPPGKSVSLHTMFSITSVGFFLNFLPGKVGEAARGFLIAKEIGQDSSVGLASVFVERLIDIIAMLMLLIVSLQFVDSQQLPYLEKIKEMALWALPAGFLLFAMFYLINFEPVNQKIFGFLDWASRFIPEKFRDKVLQFVKNFIANLKLNLSFSGFLRLFFSSFLVWLIYIPVYWFLLQGFDINVGLWEVMPFFSVLLAFASIPTPGMAGSLDAGVKMALVNLYPMYVTADVAGAFAILLRVGIMLTLISAGLYGIWHQKLSFKKLSSFREKKK